MRKIYAKPLTSLPPFGILTKRFAPRAGSGAPPAPWKLNNETPEQLGAKAPGCSGSTSNKGPVFLLKGKGTGKNFEKELGELFIWNKPHPRMW